MDHKITITAAANITYSGLTYNTRLIVEYKHTGIQWEWKQRGGEYITENAEIAMRAIKQGFRIIKKTGYYFIERMAIPITVADGRPGIWYINNSGDTYTINKASKYWRKIHKQLSINQTI